MSRVILTPQLEFRVEQYAESHATPVNKALHFVGIPFLTVASLGLLAKVIFMDGAAMAALAPNLAWIILLGLGSWYIWWDWRMGSLTYLFVIACYVVGSCLSMIALLIMFATGVVLHVIGHHCFEGKPPALLSNPIAILEAPAWLLATWGGWTMRKTGPPSP